MLALNVLFKSKSDVRNDTNYQR